jgi:gliding motility-associated-like protein
MIKSYKKSGDFSFKYMWVLLFFASLWCQNTFAQLLDFELTIIATDETCTGNATFTFTINNPTPGAVILYSVFLQPNVTVPVSVSTVPFVGSLSAGTYTVYAVETLGTTSITKQKDISIVSDTLDPIQISAHSLTNSCNTTGGDIIIDVMSGNPVNYQITQGPQVMPLQTSNVFTNMPQGVYLIIAYNECGEAWPYNYFHEVNPQLPVVSDPIFQNVLSGDCNTVTITNTLQYPANTAIVYPITVTYTIIPPDGGTPQVQTQVFTGGATNLLEFSNIFPVVAGTGYTYDISITNGCGYTISNNGLAVNSLPLATLSAVPVPCGRNYLTLNVTRFMPPYTVSFTAVPTDANGDALFDTTAFNSAYPGPYTDGSIYFGDNNNPVPEGTYDVIVTDACGRTATTTYTVIDLLPPPVGVGTNNGCYSDLGGITVTAPTREIVSASIVIAPPLYTQTHMMPQDVSPFITVDGVLVLNDLPLGDYQIRVFDTCGNEYLVDVNVPTFTPGDFSGNVYADCTEGKGGLSVASDNGKLVQMTLLQAPSAYEVDLPQNVTSFIDAQGKLYMDNLPAGDYLFSGTDICGVQRTATVTVIGYQPAPAGTSLYTFDPLCNTWNITVSDSGNTTSASYWLQKEDATQAGQWVHPATNAPYVEGTMPNANNSYQIYNGQTISNLDFNGTFRVLRAYETVGTGTGWKLCFTELGTFTYEGDVTIGGLYNISCRNNVDEVYVDASGGLAPLTYEIISMDGDTSFYLNNGTSNIFTGLQPAVYVFEVKDACGESKIITRNINLLPDLVQATFPVGILHCITADESQYQEFDLTSQNTEILGEQSPNIYTVTYYTNAADAEAGTNAITNPEAYVNTTTPQTIFAQIVHNNVTICHKVVDFTIQVSEEPQIDMGETIVLCDDVGTVTLSATPGYDEYIWSTGQITPSIIVIEPGIYSVAVKKDYGIGPCWADAEIEVIHSAIAEQVTFTLVDWTESNNSITVNLNGIGVYEYSLDGITFQDSPTFSGLETGIYTIYIQDINGCGTFSKEVALLNYPKFFTPNHDGANDTWRIEFSWFEPDMMLFIYDRYGKLLTSFNGQGSGWDGTLNGRDLPSTDYWFVAERADGRIFKGHFAMIR